MSDESAKVVMAGSQITAYPPVKRIIKLEIPDEQQEINSVEEENWTLRIPQESVVMENLPLFHIAYPPVQKNVKLESLDDEHQEGNSVEEENLTLQLPKDSTVMSDPLQKAYPPVKWNIKPEIQDKPQEVNNIEEGNRKLQVRKESVTSTGNTSIIIDLQIANASILSEESGQSKERLRDRQTIMSALEKEGTLQDTEMMEGLGSSDEEGSEDEEKSGKSEHSSLEDFDETDNSLAVYLSDGNIDMDHLPSPKTGPSKELTVENEGYRKKTSNYALLSCSQCDYQCKRKDHLQKHLINVHEIGLKQRREMPFKCTKCDSSFKQKRTLDQHMKHECGVAFNCSLCKQNFTKKSSLRKHLIIVHNMDRRKLDKFGAGYKVRPIHPFKCDQCGRTYMRKSTLTRHRTSECKVEQSFPCPKCDCRCKRKSSLKLHLIEMHKVEPCQLAALGIGPVVRPEKQFKCDRCGTSYKHRQSLRRHLVKKCGK